MCHNRFQLFALIVLSLLVAGGSAQAGVVSVEFGYSAHDVNGVAGVVPVANWNNTSSVDGSDTDLMDDAGVDTSTDIVWDGDEIWHKSPVTQATGDLNMMASFLNDTSGATDGVPNAFNTITISEIPYPEYSLIVYGHGEAGRLIQYNLIAGGSSTTKYIDLNTDYAAVRYADNDPADTNVLIVDNGYVEATDADTQGNFTVFEGLTDSSLTLEFGGIIGRGSVAGLQIVEVPEPATMSLLLAGGGLLLARRRR